MGQLYAKGMSEFHAGNYAAAAADLEALLLKAEFNPQLEPAFFTVGSAWFNAGDYKKAVAAFKKYQEKFPNGPHAADVGFGMAQANLLGKDYAAAAAQFSALEKNPALRDQALYWAAIASKEGGKIDEAVSSLEQLTKGDIRSAMAARGAMMLAQIYVQKGESPKTIALIKRIRERVNLVENVVELNSLTVGLGDDLFKKNVFGDALECYRAAYPREQLVRLQNQRLATQQKHIDDNLVKGRADPSSFGQIATINNQIKAEMAQTQKVLDDFQKLPSITPGLYIRMARCYYELDRKWESVVVYQELLDRFPKVPEREPALFGLILALADVNQAAKAQQRCEEYLRDFKDGPNAETAGYLRGAMALQANDAKAAQTFFGQALETQPNSQFKDQMRFLLGNAKFMAGQYDDATADYKKYLNDFPKGGSVEDANYRLALTALFAGKYEEAMKAVNSYLQKYPKGQFVSDAKYRLAVCKYAASLYDEVIADCTAWENEFGKNSQLGEVLALKADALAASSKEADAIPVYVRSYQIATTDEVMNYSLFAASKLLQKRGEWDKVSDLFNHFIEDKPDNPTAISALFWIGKAKAHEGKLDEAKKIAADTIGKYIGDQNKEAVEMLLTQLASLCVKKKKAEPPPEVAVAGANPEGSPSSSASPAESASPTAVAQESPSSPSGRGGSEVQTAAKPDQSAVAVASPASEKSDQNAVAAASPTATVTPEPDTDPGAELDALLSASAKDQSPTVRARILFAKAELARLRRQPAEEEKNVAKIAEVNPDDLSPLLLGKAGDYWLAQKKPDQATTFYQRLLDEFPKSDNLDFAYAGLGEIAFEKNDLKNALRLFTDGTDKIVATQKLKDITIGKAKTLMAMEKLDEAKKVFEQAASVREWRGESTAFCVYSLGEIEAKQNRWAEANAYYQRVYVAYRKYLPWVAKAYIRSGESFEKLGKTEEAANTYREMLRNEKLHGFAEAEEARKRLQAMGQPG